jgi:hypothetical protein
MRLTCFATNTAATVIAARELRHRQRARAGDRIRSAHAAGLRNLPLHHAASNQLWLEIIQLALTLLAWMPPDPWNPASARHDWRATGLPNPTTIRGPAAKRPVNVKRWLMQDRG